MKIYIKLRDRAYGPLQDDMIQKMIASGKLNPQQEISFNRKNWFPAGDCKELFSRGKPAKPFLNPSGKGTESHTADLYQETFSLVETPSEESFGNPCSLIEMDPSDPSSTFSQEKSGMSSPFVNPQNSQTSNPFGNSLNTQTATSKIPPSGDHSDQWFLSNDGRVGSGPYSSDMIIQFLKENKAHPNALIWRKDTKPSLLREQAEFRCFFNDNPFCAPAPSDTNDIPSVFHKSHKMNFQSLIKRSLDFHGRSTRKQYWIFILFCTLFFLILSIPFFLYINSLPKNNAPTNISFLFILYTLIANMIFLAGMISFLSIQVRRLHDIGFSGWFTLLSLLPIVGTLALIILSILPGMPNTNQYGPNPRINNKTEHKEIQ